MHFSNYGCTWVYEYYIYSEDCVITPARAARRATKRSPQLDATRAGRQALASSSRRSGDIQGHEQLPHSDPSLQAAAPWPRMGRPVAAAGAVRSLGKPLFSELGSGASASPYTASRCHPRLSSRTS
jgi:hypothetical protein